MKPKDTIKTEVYVKCDHCDEQKYRNVTVSRPYDVKGETIDVEVDIGLCDACGFEGADSNQMSAIQRAVAEAYRAKRGPLTLDEI